MRKLGKFIILIAIVWICWSAYGSTFQQTGITGVMEKVRTDVQDIKENQTIKKAIETINHDIQTLFARLMDKQNEGEETQSPEPEKPPLHAPTGESFSIHNIEIGEKRVNVEKEVGKPKRSSLNEYDVDWVAYHENYHHFIMVAYDQAEHVAGLYTNQDLLTSTYDIKMGTTRESVRAQLQDPLTSIRKGFIHYQFEKTDEFDTFLIDDQYVTIFYDKHEAQTVTAIQIISSNLEQKKTGFFGVPNTQLKEGFEYQLFDLTNAERVRRGLSALTWDDAVRDTARHHSADMAEHHYFSHTNLEGLSPFDRMERDGITYRIAGENLATGQSSSIFAHEGLMNSLGHRENILKEDYKVLAVGVAFDNESIPYYTENFVTK